MTLFSISLAAFLGFSVVGIAFLWCGKIRAQAAISQSAVEMNTSLVEFPQARPLMEMEMERARRLNYTLAIIALEGEKPAGSGQAAANEEAGSQQKNVFRGCDIVDLLRGTTLLRDTLRMIDIAAYDEEGHFIVILLPGSDNMHAAQTASRIKKEFQKKFEKCMRSGCAEFSSDGVILDDLIACASSRIGQSENVVRIRSMAQSNATQ